jgi:hypothetical protein
LLKTALLYAATIATALLTFPANNAVAQPENDLPAVHEPELLFDITDEVMEDPLGIIVDVAVGADGIVYLLDQQNYNIRRITFSGDLKSPLGRQGQGPGELSRPRRLISFPDGRCLVIQGMSSRTVCLTHTGDACDMGDISLFRSGYANTIIVRAELDKDQRLVLSTITTRYRASSPNTSLEDRGTVASVRRATAGGEQLESLFATETSATDENTVSIPLSSYGYVGYVRQGWDINASGVIIYSDPKGGYSVHIGHPADGETQLVDLLEWQYDEKRIKKLAKEADGKFKVDEIPRISSVEWLDNEFFMVQPNAELSLVPIANLVRTVEVFRRDGSSFGRYDIRCNFDPSVDEIFVLGDIVVLIKGGKSVARAAFSGVLPGEKDDDKPKSAETDEIRVVAYKLFGSLRSANLD